jgi:phosphatidylserine/phosphatidylglycerophosphate/cardiolipin synthase-like enzyme
MAEKIGNISMLAGPPDAGAPDNLRKAIVDFIDGANKKLEIAVQELEDDAIARAIVRARQRKVEVWMVIEADYLRASRAQPDPFVEGGENEANRQIHNAILRSNIQIRTDFNPEIFHQKFIVRDGSAVLTGSTNFTPTGVESNLNHVIIVNDPKVAKIYANEFAEIRQGHFGKLNEGHDPSPPDLKISGVPIRIAFAPDHNPEMEIMKQMLKAKKRIDFAIFTFALSSGIDDTMIAQHHAGVKVRGALDSHQANQKWAATRPIHNAGAALWLVKKSATVNKLHHKLMVLDEQVIVAGSFNYTSPATRLNDENIVVIGDLEDQNAQSIERQRKLAKFALAEIDRIIKDHGTKLV